MGDHMSSLKRNMRFSILSVRFGLCRGRIMTQFQDIHPSAIVTIWERRSYFLVYAEIASLVSPISPRSSEIVSENVVAAICDDEAPCSLSTTLHHSTTLSSASTTRSLYVWRCFASSAFFR